MIVFRVKYSSSFYLHPAEKFFNFIIELNIFYTVQYLFFILTLFVLYGDPSGTGQPDDPGQAESDSLRIVRGPYLQSGTKSGIIIRWRTNIPTESRVVYGKTFGNLNLQTEDNEKTIEHIVQIQNLEWDTKYYYGVGNSLKILSAPDSSYYFITTPDQFTKKSIRIWAIGDFGTGDPVAKSVKDAYLQYRGNHHTDVWLMLGDIAYMYGSDEQFQHALFDNMYDELLRNTVVWPTPGNHDMGSADSQTQSGPYYEIFSLPTHGEAGGIPSGTEAYYAFDYGNVHFISLDTEDNSLDVSGDMLTWLEKDLENNRLQWTIVYFHHPPYTRGTYNSDYVLESGGRMTYVRENVLPILDKYGVDLVLSGHSHTYERSYLIMNHYGKSKTFKAKIMIPGGKKKRYPKSYIKYDQEPGTIYVVCGVSGNRPSAEHGGHRAMAFCTDQYRGSMAIEINQNQLYTIFLDTQGKARDWFRIEKKGKSVSEISDVNSRD